MTQSVEAQLSFNLWTQPWIGLERSNASMARSGIAGTLLHCHEYAAIYDPSPLVVVGIHRLLVAILQDALSPTRVADLRALLDAGCFPPDAIERFATQYAHRFDLFSPDVPFLQSADLPLAPAKGDKPKTVAYLAPELPSGTAVTHFRHGGEDAQCFCPACCAAELAVIPPFATSGGRGYPPSINGVPPIYVLPGGETLFDSLFASLLLPQFFTQVADREHDLPWWQRQPLVERGLERVSVGYLDSLTFPARRVRLHPSPQPGTCTRCGSPSTLTVRSMIFEMGECRSKEAGEAAPWFDPFAAYRTREQKVPVPIRPVEGHPAWREFSALFLKHPAGDERKAGNIRPRVLDQLAALADLEIITAHGQRFFRCIGMRTDMKAKIFEWVDAGFDVPIDLLRDEQAGPQADRATQFAADAAAVIARAFQKYFGGKSKKAERYQHLKGEMLARYWSALAAPFRVYILALAETKQYESAFIQWADAVLRCALDCFIAAIETTGTQAEALRRRCEAEQTARILLGGLRKKELNHDQ